MSDIDFDELDRAVNSVLNGSSGKQAEPAVAQPPIDLSVQPTPLEQPAPAVSQTPAEEAAPVPAPEAVPEQVPVEAGKPIAASAQALHPVAQKPVQRGRFLDMVHPAHDMAPRQAVPVSSSRPAPVVSQSANQTFVSDVVSPTAPAAPEDQAAPAQPVEQTPPVASAPIPEAPVVQPEQTEQAPEIPAEPADFFAGGPTDKTADPAPSPFIPDAKVEKRPLGSFNPVEPSVLPVGDELHEKLVQVESEDNVIETAESPIPRRVDPTPVSAPDPTPVAPVKPDETIKDEAKTSVLDHPAKNRQPKPPKHGKGTIIWVTVAVAVLLIGIGVGATVFLLVLR